MGLGSATGLHLHLCNACLWTAEAGRLTTWARAADTQRGSTVFPMSKASATPASEGDVWYFAYGSNLDPDRKEFRTGAIREEDVTACYLPNYRLAFNKWSSRQGYCANVIPAAGDRVYGVCYRCDAETIRKLDFNEGVHDADGYRRFPLIAFSLSGSEQLSAETYVFPNGLTTHPEYRPTDAYLDHILHGLRHDGLPEHAHDALRQHAMGLPAHLR